MRATDLRVGNLVIVENSLRDESGYVHKITEVRQLDCQVQLNKMDIIYGQKYKNIKPIPLTEEYLRKFGFDTMRSGLHRLVIGEKAIFYVLLMDNKRYCSLSNSFTETRIPKDANYVHELQNLYFALTGKELVFSEA